MAISYNGLWKILIDNGMKKGDLKRRTGISSGTIAKMTNGEAVTLTVLEKTTAQNLFTNGQAAMYYMQ